MFAFSLSSVNPASFLCSRATAVQERGDCLLSRTVIAWKLFLGWCEVWFAAFQANEEIESKSPATWKSFLISRLLLKYTYQHKHLYLRRKIYQLCIILAIGCLEHTLRLDPSAN